MKRVRLALPEDAEAIARVHVRSWQTTYRGLVPDEVLVGLSVERRGEWWKSVIGGPEQTGVAVAEEARQVVGFASYGAEHQGDSVYRGELFALYLLKEHQRKGWGRLLVAAAAEGLLQKGLTNMLVWVLSENPARSFYEKLGGVYLREKPIEIGGAALQESAYGWTDVHSLILVR